MISLDVIHSPISAPPHTPRLIQLALALDSGSACRVFPGQAEVGHTVPSVSAYIFSVCDDKAQLHRDKQTEFCVALIHFMQRATSAHYTRISADTLSFTHCKNARSTQLLFVLFLVQMP